MNPALSSPAAAEGADPGPPSEEGQPGGRTAGDAPWIHRWVLALALVSAAAAALALWMPRAAPHRDPAPEAGVQGPAPADAERLRRAADGLVVPLFGLDPIDRMLALREWESAAGVRLRWAQAADRERLSAEEQIELLSGAVVLRSPAPSERARVQAWVAVPRSEGAPGSSAPDLLVVELPESTQAPVEAPRLTPVASSAAHRDAGPASGTPADASVPARTNRGLELLGAGAAGLLLAWAAAGLSRRWKTTGDATDSGPVPQPPARPAIDGAAPVDGPTPVPDLARADALQRVAEGPPAGAEAPRRLSPPPLPIEDGFDLVGLLRREVEAVRRQQALQSEREIVPGEPSAPMIDFDPELEGAVPHQPALLARAVRGLLGQAVDRARRHVVLGVRQEGGRVLIEIDDDGDSPYADPSRPSSGLEPDDAEWVFAETVAHWHGGQIIAARAPLGGVRRVIAWTLPPAADVPSGAEAAWPPGLRRDRRTAATSRGRRRGDLGYT